MSDSITKTLETAKKIKSRLTGKEATTMDLLIMGFKRQVKTEANKCT